MKNIILKMLLFICIFSMILFLKEEIAVTEIILGDVNEDYIVNAEDIKLIAKHISESKKNINSEWILTEEKLDSADVNRDGKVNNGDIVTMLRYLTTKSNPYNIGISYEIELKKEIDETMQQQQEVNNPISLDGIVENTTINSDFIKELGKNQKIDNEKVAVNVMQKKLASSNKISFEREQVEIKTEEVEKLKIITENTNEPIKITSSDTDIVELFGVGIAVGKKPGEAIITAEQGNEKTQCKVIVVDRNEAVYNVEIDKKEINLETGETAKLEAKTEPINRDIKWSTSNNEIIEVREDGTVISKKAGVAAVYATSGTKSATCVITVKDKEIAINEITFDKSEVEIIHGQTAKVTARIKPNNATLREIELIPENDNVQLKEKKVQVDEDGKAEIEILANKPGKVTLNAKAEKKVAKTTITIKEAEAEKIILDTSEIKMEENQLRRITATIEPEIASYKKIKWTSDNSDVATVDENGIVKSKKVGEATITASVSGKSATCKVKVEKAKVSVRDIKINQSVTVKEDQEVKIQVELVPKNATNREIIVKLNNENANIVSEKVTVGDNGKAEIKITGKKVGKSVLTVSSGAVVAKCDVNIIPKVIPVSKITMSATQITIDKGKSAKIKVKIEPTNATNKEITFKLNNSNISVDKAKAIAGNDGTVEVTITGKKAGKSSVTAKAGDKSVKCNVKVNAVVENVRINEKNFSLEVGQSKQLTTTITPSDAVNKKLTWTSSDSGAVIVDQNGKVTAKDPGKTVTITAKASNGVSGTCTIKTTKTITVTFNANGGKGGGTRQYTFGKKNQKFDVTCTRSGYTLVGWNTKANGKGTTYSVNSGVSDNWIRNNSSKVTLYAMWKKISNFKNPIMSGQDPWVYQKDGYYYFIRSTGDGIQIYKTNKLNNLTQSGGKVVYSSGGSSIWAPELHFFNGKWYIYAAILYGSNDGDRRMYVLESNSSDPLGGYTMIGQLETGGWAIDGTVFKYNNKLYFVWSGWPGGDDGIQNLYIAPMSSPKKISGGRTLISSPSNSWERKDYPYINEGPEVLMNNGKVFIVYSANGSWHYNYCLATLTLNGNNPLDASAWRKSNGPVFSSDNGVYGPGHASFVKSPDRKEDWIVYHANTNPNTPSGDSWWENRKIFIQKFGWNSNGTPNFGSPLSTSTSIQAPSGTP